MKNRSNHDRLLAEGVVSYGVDSKGQLWENGKPVTTAKATEPPKIKPTAEVVERPRPTNPAPKLIDRKVPATGLQRAINANMKSQGFEVPTPKVEESKATGLQRAINAYFANQKKA